MACFWVSAAVGKHKHSMGSTERDVLLRTVKKGIIKEFTLRQAQIIHSAGGKRRRKKEAQIKYLC